MTYTAEDVHTILRAVLKGGFLMDIPAVHKEGKMYFEADTLEIHLDLPTYGWTEDIARVANED